MVSLYGNYVSDDYTWGRVGLTAGFQHTSFTSGTVPGAVIYPAYYLVNMSAFYQEKNFEIDVNVNNLFNKHAQLENLYTENLASAAFNEVVTNQPLTGGVDISYKF